jgi:hypothetical protein
LRHHRPAHGDTQTQIATSAFGATIPHGSANRHPSKPHKPRRFTPQCEKCGLVQRVAFILAQASLGEELVPTDFRRDDVERRFVEARLETAEASVDALITSGLLHQRTVAGLSILRFQFDPVAEYFAAIATCRLLGDDRSAWLAHIAHLTNMATYADGIRGYLNAISVCYASYMIPLRLAAVEIPWRQ